ncbi:ADP-ribosylation factor GTPase-activating protein [Trichinella pseudospiralis]
MHFLSLRAPLLKRQTTVSMPCLQLMIDGSQQMMSSTLICFPPQNSGHWRVSRSFTGISSITTCGSFLSDVFE